MHPLIRKPAIAVLTVAFLLIGLVAPAHAAGAVNSLAHYCDKRHPVSCVELTDVDTLLTTHRITVVNEAGTTRVLTGADTVWRWAHARSTPCPKKGDLMGCYFTDPFAGRSIVLPDGTSVAVRLFR